MSDRIEHVEAAGLRAGAMLAALRPRIAQVLREQGWTSDTHEPADLAGALMPEITQVVHLATDSLGDALASGIASMIAEAVKGERERIAGVILAARERLIEHTGAARTSIGALAYQDAARIAREETSSE